MHHTVCLYGQVSCFLRPGNSGRIGTEISAERATPFAFASRLARIPALLNMYFPGFGQMSATALDHMTAFIKCIDPSTDFRFHTVHFPGRQKIAVRQCVKAIKISADSCKMFYMEIPGRQLFISQWPFHRESIPPRSFKIIFTPSLCLPGPEQGFSAHLISPDPVKWFFLNVGMFIILYKKLLAGFVECITLIYNRIFFRNG